MNEENMIRQIRSMSARYGVLRHFPPFLATLGVEAPRAHAIASEFTDLLDKPEHCMLEEIGLLLVNEGLDEPWGQALATARAEYLARWVVPQLKGEKILDLLCGDGAVAVRIEAATGKSLQLVERHGQRGVVERQWLGRIEDLDAFAQNAQPASFDTAILSTVLHHELDPESTLALAARCARRRIVLLENCLEPKYSEDYHMLVDAMFNRSLYRTHLAAPGEHRTAEEWCAMCERYGRARIVGRSVDVPGIPLAHTLIVIDLEEDV